MQGDYSRLTFRKGRHYSGVRMQQGRVWTDADFNEEVQIGLHRERATTRDVIGSSGTPGPLAEAGFAVVPDGAGDLEIGPGTYYVEGILCENEARPPGDPPLTYSAQKSGDHPDAKLPKATQTGTYLAYLDVWERHITALDDSAIREVALNGPDTAARTRVVWQVRLLKLGAHTADISCHDAHAALTSATVAPTGRVSARSEQTSGPSGPCVLPPDAGYHRLENQLYRVEVHESGTLGGGGSAPTFKWSRENGSVVASWTGQDATNKKLLTVSSIGRDQVLGFRKGDWVELTDDEHELEGEPGRLVRVARAEGDTLEIDFGSGGTVNFASFGPGPKIRRWDMSGGATTIERPAANEGYLALEGGVEVRFADGTYRSGDYWLIPARTRTRTVEWPKSGGAPDALLPFGIEHGYAGLSVLKWDGATWTIAHDCRKVFCPLTGIGMQLAGGDGQSAVPGTELCAPIQVRTSRGCEAAHGQIVVFQLEAGMGGELRDASDATNKGTLIQVVTGVSGLASCYWTLDDDASCQRVMAFLEDRPTTTLFFNAQTRHDLEEGFRVRRVGFVGGRQIENDGLYDVSEMKSGLQVDFTEKVDPDAVHRPAIDFRVEVAFPNELKGFAVPIAVLGKANAVDASVRWVPTNAKILQELAKQAVAQAEDFLLARLVLRGRWIWSAKDPSRYLDGEARGLGDPGGATNPTGRRATRLELRPNATPRAASDFETWFWLRSKPPVEEGGVDIVFTTKQATQAEDLNLAVLPAAGHRVLTQPGKVGRGTIFVALRSELVGGGVEAWSYQLAAKGLKIVKVESLVGALGSTTGTSDATKLEAGPGRVMQTVKLGGAIGALKANGLTTVLAIHFQSLAPVKKRTSGVIDFIRTASKGPQVVVAGKKTKPRTIHALPVTFQAREIVRPIDPNGGVVFDPTIGHIVIRPPVQ